MANFPTSLPSFAGFTSSHTLAQDSHAAQHNLEQDEVVALATKMGTGSSTPVANRVLRGTGAGISSWAQANLTTDVTDVLPVANGGTNASTAANARNNLGVNTKTEILKAVYPVGSIYVNATDSTNPGTLLGFGTWAAFGSGRVMVGLNSGDTDFDTAEETGGAKTHTLTTDEIPGHTHTVQYGLAGVGTGSNLAARLDVTGNNELTTSTGGGSAHNNVQPYIVVYMWKRTA